MPPEYSIVGVTCCFGGALLADDALTISSSRVRELLAAGDVAAARELTSAFRP